MKRLAITSALIGITALVVAMGGFNKVFETKYNVKAGSALANAKCGLCHLPGGHKMNPYGADLKAAMGTSKKLTPEALAKIENLDSNKNGKKNIEEIKADKLPGATAG